MFLSVLDIESPGLSLFGEECCIRLHLCPLASRVPRVFYEILNPVAVFCRTH